MKNKRRIEDPDDKLAEEAGAAASTGAESSGTKRKEDQPADDSSRAVEPAGEPSEGADPGPPVSSGAASSGLKRKADEPADDSGRAEEPREADGGSPTVSYTTDISEANEDAQM